MTYEQLENCYKTVLKQRDVAEAKLQLLVSLIDKRVGDMPEELKAEFIQKLSELDL
ncbi:hypothetical protein [Vibrio alginolyticus]